MLKNNNSQTHTDTAALAGSVINGKQRHFDHIEIKSSKMIVWYVYNQLNNIKRAHV